jgi:hypothetical protein
MARAWIGLTALLVGVIAGCGVAGGLPSAGSPPTGSALTSAATTGAVEPTGPPPTEGPPATGNGPRPETRPTVYVPTMPNGGGDEEKAGDGGRHCVSLQYLDDNNRIPNGVEAVWNRPKLTAEAAAYFADGDFTCTNGRQCEGFVWTAENQQDDECWVPVQEQGTWQFDEQSAEFTTTGSLVCPAGQKALCEDFLTRMTMDQTGSVPVLSDGTGYHPTTPTDQATSEPAEPTEAPTEAPTTN